MSELSYRVLEWLGAGDVGASSKAMALQLVGVKNDGSHPWDPSDLGRCLRFMDAVPAARLNMDRFVSMSPTWRILVQRWDELEALYRAEAAAGMKAPKTFDLMQEICKQGRRGGSGSGRAVVRPVTEGGV